MFDKYSSAKVTYKYLNYNTIETLIYDQTILKHQIFFMKWNKIYIKRKKKEKKLVVKHTYTIFC